MNGKVKIILIIAACMIPAGIIVAMLGVSFGGNPSWSLGFTEGKVAFSTEYVSNTVDIDEFDTLSIETSTADINIVRGSKYQIEYKTREGKEPVITQENGRLTVKQPSMGFVMFDLGFVQDNNTYTITVPEDSDEIALDLKSSTGDVFLDRLKVSGRIVSSSADVQLNDIEGESLDINVSSGDIEGDKVKIGKIRLEGSTSDIEILRLESDDVFCHTSTGDIEINDSAVSNIKCEASTGDVVLALNGNESDYSYNISVSTGDITVNSREYNKEYVEERNSGNTIDIKTSTGDVDVNTR